MATWLSIDAVIIVLLLLFALYNHTSLAAFFFVLIAVNVIISFRLARRLLAGHSAARRTAS